MNAVQPRFLVDVNVGRLAKWLRVMGYDAKYIPDAQDTELVRIAQEEKRLLLTRDRCILERRRIRSGEVKAMLIRSDDFREQIRELNDSLQLESVNGFTLCIECNQELIAVSKHSVQGKVPQFVFDTQEQFFICPSCTRLYWRGTHWRNMNLELDSIKEGV